MGKYLMSVETMFWVNAENEEEAYAKAFESMPLSDLEFMIMETDEEPVNEG